MTNPPQTHRGLLILGAPLALLNLVLWFSVPAISAVIDQITGRRGVVQPGQRPNPQFMIGTQELFVYFDPWLARGVFPIIYTVGLAAIPFLTRPGPGRNGSQPGWTYSVMISVLLIGLEMVWLFLIFVTVFLRGPDWNLYWPGEEWDPYKIVPINNVNLSEFFWLGVLKRPGERDWYIRELPGLALLAVYFATGIASARVLFQLTGQTTPYWRWTVLLLLILIAGLVPLKMFLRWVFNIKYLICLPEYWFNV